MANCSRFIKHVILTLCLKWMTVNNAIFTPYVCKELADAESGSKVMVLNVKRVSIDVPSMTKTII